MRARRFRPDGPEVEVTLGKRATADLVLAASADAWRVRWAQDGYVYYLAGEWPTEDDAAQAVREAGFYAMRRPGAKAYPLAPRKGR